ncbi:hypothetical protein HD806DRAFT_483216 [Xylariaceae sp. AK1471]|nr:hypothetical protein HD806DRAFT_483216 [Xylariaceae sp. AK1471]
MSEPSAPTISLDDSHPLRLTLANDNDLEDITDFVAQYALVIKLANGIIPRDLIDLSAEQLAAEMKKLIKERYKVALKAILDSCTAGSMTGMVWMIKQDTTIHGVMALNIVSAKSDDRWSLNEAKVMADKEQPRWPFLPVYACDRLKRYTLRNNGRPMINVPYLAVQRGGDLENICAVTFINQLNAITTFLNYGAVVNIFVEDGKSPFVPHVKFQFRDTDPIEELDMTPKEGQKACKTYRILGRPPPFKSDPKEASLDSIVRFFHGQKHNPPNNQKISEVTGTDDPSIPERG